MFGGSAPFALGLLRLEAQLRIRRDYRLWSLSALFGGIIVLRGSPYVHSFGGATTELSDVHAWIIAFGGSALFAVGLSCLEAQSCLRWDHRVWKLSAVYGGIIVFGGSELFTVRESCLAAHFTSTLSAVLQRN